jgi:hypothetical protein
MDDRPPQCWLNECRVWPAIAAAKQMHGVRSRNLRLHVFDCACGFRGEATHRSIRGQCPASRRASSQFGAAASFLTARGAEPLRAPLQAEWRSAPNTRHAAPECRCSHCCAPAIRAGAPRRPYNAARRSITGWPGRTSSIVATTIGVVGTSDGRCSGDDLRRLAPRPVSALELNNMFAILV